MYIFSKYIYSMPLNFKLIIIIYYNLFKNIIKVETDIINFYIEFIYIYIPSKFKIYKQRYYWVITQTLRNNIIKIRIYAFQILINEKKYYIYKNKKLTIFQNKIIRYLKKTVYYNDNIHKNSIITINNKRILRKNYIKTFNNNNIIKTKIKSETEEYIIGQVNTLSGLDYSINPIFGKIPKIICILHWGKGEINDIKCKYKINNNIYTKDIMIIKALLINLFKINNKSLPFTFSLLFKKANSEINEDSNLLAELIAIISAISDIPVNQQIAVTGSMDKFGNVQSIGGINEKIEYFYNICNNRGLTKFQGVIFPLENINHLCLNKNIIKAVQKKKFFLWSVNTVYEALEIIMNIPFYHQSLPNLLYLILQRIDKFNKNETSKITPLVFSLLSFLKKIKKILNFFNFFF